MNVDFFYDLLMIIVSITFFNKVLLTKQNKIVFKFVIKHLKVLIQWLIKQESPYTKPRPLLDKVVNYYLAYVMYIISFTFFLYAFLIGSLWVTKEINGLLNTVIAISLLLFFTLCTRVYIILGDESLYNARNSEI